jgi:hypothetical protein
MRIAFVNLSVSMSTASFPWVDRGSPVTKSRQKTERGRHGDLIVSIRPLALRQEGFAKRHVGAGSPGLLMKGLLGNAQGIVGRFLALASNVLGIGDLVLPELTSRSSC